MNMDEQDIQDSCKTKPKGRHPQKALSAAFIRSAPPGRHADGNGLYLFVQPSGTRSWIQRLLVRGRRRELGLGSGALVRLAEAREKARGSLFLRQDTRSEGGRLRLRSGFGNHGVLQHSDRIDLDADGFTRLQPARRCAGETYARGSAGGDRVARFQCGDGG